MPHSVLSNVSDITTHGTAVNLLHLILSAIDTLNSCDYWIWTLSSGFALRLFKSNNHRILGVYLTENGPRRQPSLHHGFILDSAAVKQSAPPAHRTVHCRSLPPWNIDVALPLRITAANSVPFLAPLYRSLSTTLNRTPGLDSGSLCLGFHSKTTGYASMFQAMAVFQNIVNLC